VDRWTRWKSRGGKSQRREGFRREEVISRKIKEGRRKKSRNTVFFPMFCVSGGSKSRLAKAAGAEASDRIRNQKLHAAVARNVFPSQNIILAIPWVGSTWSIL